MVVFSTFAVAAIGALSGPATMLAGQSGAVPAGPHWTDVLLATELRDKDTGKIDVITAGEQQKSSFDQCSASADVVLCRILVSAVSVATIIGTSFPTK